MKIGLIADTHGNLAGWRQAQQIILSSADIIVHCGDVLHHVPKFAPVAGYDPPGLAEAINQTPVPVLIARGNADSDIDQLVLDVPLQQPYLFAQVDSIRLLATHGHLQDHEELVELAQKWQVDYLLTGHTHVPVVERLGPLTHINPGTTTYPLAEDEGARRRTCGVIEEGEVRLFDLDTGQAFLSHSQ